MDPNLNNIMYPTSTNKMNANFDTNVFDSKKLAEPLIGVWGAVLIGL